LERLNIEPGKFCEDYVAKMYKKSDTAKARKAMKEVKCRRNELKNKKSAKLAMSEIKEGKTYESNIGLNLQLPNNTVCCPVSGQYQY
jgi:hypothetical protein